MKSIFGIKETQSNRPIVSFLIGSGFSIPDGVRGVKEINSRLSKIDASEILIHTDMTAIFLNGQKDINPHTNFHEKLFVQEFLKFYNEKKIKAGETFHYEIFYDFYSDYLRGIGNKNEIDDFVDWFNKENTNPEIHSQIDASNRINDFNRTFNQLLSSLINNANYFRDISSANHYPYDNFTRFLKKVVVSHDVKIHSLNHDLLFEYLGKKHSDLSQYFTDGYDIAGSPFYGKVNFDFNRNDPNNPIVEKSYFVKLSRFTNQFNKPIALFKLHGSIMSYRVHRVHSHEPIGREMLRIKSDYAVGRYFEEVLNEKTGEHRFEVLWDEPDPDFLSGTTEKTRRYGEPYYKILFDHFKNNLILSNVLLVIGYGFQDSEINNYVENNFLIRGKKMVVIGRSKPDCILLDKYSVDFISVGLEGLNSDDYNSFLNSISTN